MEQHDIGVLLIYRW